MPPESKEKKYDVWLEASKNFLSSWSSIFAGSMQQANPFFQTQKSPDNPGRDPLQTLSETLTSMFPAILMFQGTGGPGVTLQKDYFELMQSSVDLWKEWADLCVDFSRMWFKTNAAILEKLPSLKSKTTGNATPEEFTRQTYNLWVEEAAREMDRLLHDENFSKKLGSFLSKALDTRKKADLIMEKFYAMMNIPTRSEIDRVYKELHDLKRKVGRRSTDVENEESKR
jgi:hypothetical protein